ncbi:hypothetical protein UY3_16174 [Chelonia mydas]|uniref:Uncharacterized protein n=1 Tax=Chelonia mydas TaxID=8469 RepID=M7AQ95_CHEMY|nr:hypothetical protein UY3_16174 [Chelonia mydas]
MVKKGYKRDMQQCCMKAKELLQVYQKAREANSRSGAEPQTCYFYKELHTILGGVLVTPAKSPVDTSEDLGSQTPEVNCEKKMLDKEEEEEYGGQATRDQWPSEPGPVLDSRSSRASPYSPARASMMQGKKPLEDSSSEIKMKSYTHPKNCHHYPSYMPPDFEVSLPASAWPGGKWKVPGPSSHWSYSVASERRALALLRSAPDPDLGTEPSADTQDVGPMEVVETEEEEEAPFLVQASSFSPEEAVSGPSSLLPQDDFRAHQELLKRIAANLGLEVEELKKSSHSLIDILAAAAPSKVALPINEAVMGPVKTLWQTPSSLSPTSKRTEKKYCMPAKG